MKNRSQQRQCILLTRPRDQGRSLASRIEAEGGSTRLFPTLEIVPRAGVVFAQAVQGMDIVIFVSLHAVRHARVEAAQMPAQTVVFAVGPKTHQALAARGISAVCAPAPYTSEDLLGVEALQTLAGKHVLIVSGLGGRAFLSEQLLLRGASVTKLPVYRRVCPKGPTADQCKDWQAHVNVVVATSVEGLDNLCALVPALMHAWLFSVALVVVSERMGDYAKSLGFARVYVASGPTNEDIIQKAVREPL